MRVSAGVLLLVVALASCSEEKAPDPPWRAALVRSEAAVREGRDAIEERNAAAAEEAFRRAYREAVRSLRLLPGESDGAPRAMVLAHISYVSNELGLFEPYAYVRALRFGRAAAEADPAHPKPWLDLGVAFARLGLERQALNAFARSESLMPPDDPDETLREKQAVTLRNLAVRRLNSGELGSEGEGRHLLMQAMEIGAGTPAAGEAASNLAEVNEVYAVQANAAPSPLAAAAVMARFGFREEAEGLLTQVRNLPETTSAEQEEIRWLRARFIFEAEDAGLAVAERLYREMIGRGERLASSMAGLARVLTKQGREGEAIERFADHPHPSPELRVELFRAHLAALRRHPAGNAPTEESQAALEPLLQAEIPEKLRAELLLEWGLEAVRLGWTDRVTRVSRELQRRFPGDLRHLVLEAALLDLTGAPLLPEEEP